MNNLDVIKQILMSECDYWLIAKKNYVRRYGTDERLKDQILFISFPRTLPRGLKYEEITLKHIESFNGLYIDCNIFLNEPYTPFQIGTSFYDVWKAVPIEVEPKKFLIEAINKTDGDIFDYEKLYNELKSRVGQKENNTPHETLLSA